jgi:folate-binding protein YgfZ
VKSGDFNGQAIIALGLAGPFGAFRRFVIPGAAFEAFTEALEKAGVTAMTSTEYEVLRIEGGLPGPDGELTEDFTPLETGLGDLVSDTKGCYTGQEVIARQITYDKITRGLAGIRLEEPARAGARVFAGESSAGSVTSYANSPRAGYLALAVLKRPYGEPGTEVRVETGNGEVAGKVVELPFS